MRLEYSVMYEIQLCLVLPELLTFQSFEQLRERRCHRSYPRISMQCVCNLCYYKKATSDRVTYSGVAISPLTTLLRGSFYPDIEATGIVSTDITGNTRVRRCSLSHLWLTIFWVFFTIKCVPRSICSCMIRVWDRDGVASILDVDEVTDDIRLRCTSTF